MIGTVRTAVAAPPLCLWLGCVKFFKMIGRMPDLGVSQKGCQISRCPSLGMFGSVWECLGVFGSVWECLGISRAAVVRFAEKTGGVAAQLHPNEPTWQQPDSDIASFLMKYLLPTDVPSLLFSSLFGLFWSKCQYES